MKVYGVYNGCIYEGGGVGTLHKTKDGALAHAKVLFEQEVKRHEEVWPIEEDKELHEQYKWHDRGDGKYDNGIDEIYVVEYDVLD